MRYDEQALQGIAEKYSEINRIHDRLMVRLFAVSSRICDPKAQEHLTQGVARRLGILTRCIHNIFNIFPVQRTKLFAPEELTDLEINLHAFFVNISGLFDNLAWVFVIENGLVGDSKQGKLNKKDIGLFLKKAQSHFPENLRSYLNSERIAKWYSEYSKNYRDALAHRIPMYIPPFVIFEEDQQVYVALEEEIQRLAYATSRSSLADELRAKQRELGKLSLIFKHSYEEESLPVFMHSQIIIDYLTVEEVTMRTCDEFWPTTK